MNYCVAESDWLYCSLDQHRRCQLVTENEIRLFTGSLQLSDLHNIATELHHDNSVIEQYQSTDPQSVSTQAFKLLNDWTLNEAGSATVANFVLRMRNAGIADDVIKSAVLHSCLQKSN